MRFSFTRWFCARSASKVLWCCQFIRYRWHFNFLCHSYQLYRCVHRKDDPQPCTLMFLVFPMHLRRFHARKVRSHMRSLIVVEQLSGDRNCTYICHLLLLCKVRTASCEIRFQSTRIVRSPIISFTFVLPIVVASITREVSLHSRAFWAVYVPGFDTSSCNCETSFPLSWRGLFHSCFFLYNSHVLSPLPCPANEEDNTTVTLYPSICPGTVSVSSVSSGSVATAFAVLIRLQKKNQ